MYHREVYTIMYSSFPFLAERHASAVNTVTVSDSIPKLALGYCRTVVHILGLRPCGFSPPRPNWPRENGLRVQSTTGFGPHNSIVHIRFPRFVPNYAMQVWLLVS